MRTTRFESVSPRCCCRCLRRRPPGAGPTVPSRRTSSVPVAAPIRHSVRARLRASRPRPVAEPNDDVGDRFPRFLHHGLRQLRTVRRYRCAWTPMRPRSEGRLLFNRAPTSADCDIASGGPGYLCLRKWDFEAPGTTAAWGDERGTGLVASRTSAKPGERAAAVGCLTHSRAS